MIIKRKIRGVFNTFKIRRFLKTNKTQHRDTGNTGHTKHNTQRDTGNTERRQNKTQHRDTGNTGHRTKNTQNTTHTETLATLGTHDTGRKQTNQ